MAAYSDVFPWPSHYGEFSFFEQRMREHNRVRSIEARGSGYYLLTKIDGSILTAFICECYSFGMAEYVETTSKLGKIDVVVINSIWCGYTDDLKIRCRNDRVGLFGIKDFMAALNKSDFWLYLDEYDTKKFKDRGLI